MNPTQTKLLSKSFFSILFIALFFSSTAQTKSINKFYLQGGIGASTHNGGFGDISLQTIIKNKWSVTLSYQSMTMDPKNLPSDYQPETGYVLFIPYTYQVTTDMNIVSLTAGRNFKLGRNVWATTEGGPSYVSGEKINFQRMEVVSSNAIIIASTGANYATFREKKNAIGLSMRADLNWAFSSFMGLGCGVFTNINSIQSPVGAQVKLIIGYMGREKKRK